MTPNGVQMLAAVNGRGAYESNGPKKQRKKAAKQRRKATSYTARAKRKGISATKRAKYRRKAAKARKRSVKRTKKAEYQKYVKKLANSAGLTRKQLIALLRDNGLSKSDAKCVADGGVCKTGVGASSSGEFGRSLSDAAKEIKEMVQYHLPFSPNAKAEIFFDNRRRKDTNMAGRKRKRSGRKAARRGARKAARRRSSRRSSSRSRRRSSGRRRSTKRSRKAGRRSSGRRRSRRGMRRNGSDEFEMNGDDFSMNGHDYESNPYAFEANKKKRGKKRGSSQASKFNKKLLKETGILRDFGPEPVAGMMIDSLAQRLQAGQITLEQYKQLRKQVAKHYFPKQEGRGGKVGVTITDPITGKSKTVKVPWKGKVRTAFGPFKRRQKGGMYTYEWEKGEKIPPWALSGAYSNLDNEILMRVDQDYQDKSNEIMGRVMAARERVAQAERAELNRKIEKLNRKLSSGQVEDPMTPNKRGRGRRRGRRMSAAQKKALVARLNRGKRAAAKRRGRKGGRKSSRRSSRRGKGRRRSSKRRSTRRGKGRRRSSKRRSTRGRRRGRKAGRRRGKARRRGRKAGRRRGKARRRGFRKNFSISGDYNFVEILVGGLLGGAGMFFLQKYLAPHVLSAVPSVAAYTPAISGTVGGLATALIANKFLESSPAKDFVNAAALGMFLGGFGLAAPALMSNFGISGIPYVNTSGWGSRRPVGAYELRGTGAYELRGMGAYPQQALAGGQYAQALASYELRGMGAYPQQALAGGQYAQALAAYELRGLGQQPVDDGILPMHADAALDWADQDTEGEYVNSQLQPAAPLFFQDNLANLGVPPNMGGGIPSMSIWNPTGDTDVDQSATVGGIFDDPNVLPERAEPLDMMSGGRFKPHT